MSEIASIHINSIVKVRDQINFELYTNKNYPLAISQMIGLISMLKPADQPQEILTSLMNEDTALETERSTTKLANRLRGRKNIYIGWWFSILKILWNKNYLEAAGYSMMYPSELPKGDSYISPLLQRPKD